MFHLPYAIIKKINKSYMVMPFVYTDEQEHNKKMDARRAGRPKKEERRKKFNTNGFPVSGKIKQKEMD